MSKIQGGDLVLDLMAEFSRAETTAQYNAAKARMERTLDHVGVLAMVDTLIDAHNRISGVRK